jgi:hypothetical protein
MLKQIELYHQNRKRYVHDVDIISTNQIAQLVELMAYLESLTISHYDLLCLYRRFAYSFKDRLLYALKLTEME